MAASTSGGRGGAALSAPASSQSRAKASWLAARLRGVSASAARRPSSSAAAGQVSPRAAPSARQGTAPPPARSAGCRAGGSPLPGSGSTGRGSAPDGPPPRSGAAGSVRCPPGRARHRSGWQCICRWRSGRPTAPRRSGSGVLWAGYPAPRQGLRCLSNHKAISDTSNQ